jgi:serpin B
MTKLFSLILAVFFGYNTNAAVVKESVTVQEINQPAAAVKSWDDFELLQLNSEPNKMVSPASIKQALGLLAHGLDETKSKTFVNSLGYENIADYDKSIETLIEKYSDSESAKPSDKYYQPPVVQFANAVWYADNKYVPQEKYKNDIAKTFGADIAFVPKTEFADKVNAWTADKTKGKIDRIVTEETVQDPSFKALLENAAYFKAQWASPFLIQNTKDTTFYNYDGTTAKVPMMYQNLRMSYYKGDGFSAVQLRYSGKDLSMIILLQDAESSKPFKPTQKILDEVLQNSKSRKVNLYLPKFHTEYQLEKELLDYLKPYGMFGVPANNMFIQPAGSDPLAATDIIHKTVIDTDENGTEAAAVTSVIMNTTAAFNEDPPAEFKADRPFYYVIRDNQLGENLFAGVQNKF